MAADYFPLIMHDIWEKLDKDSADYFREDREKMMGGKTLEELKEGREASSPFSQSSWSNSCVKHCFQKQLI